MNKYLQYLFLTLFISNNILAQNCPENLDFENGSFNNWQCLDGRISLSDDPSTGPVTVSIVNSSPIPGRHIVMSEQSTPVLDHFGKFPVLAPNGSNYSVKIGNTANGGLVTGAKYNLQVPLASDEYYLQYNYAVVYENPNHQLEYQPRFEIRIKDLTTNEIIDCSSQIFYPVAGMQGFLVSDNLHFGTKVLYKNWTPSTLLLKNMAGKTVEISFIVTGCGYSEHFGYAYLDVNSKCVANFKGSSYCDNDTALQIKGPAGYESYRWFNTDFSQQLSTAQNLIIQPPPPTNTVYQLVTKLFYKPNCRDTFKINVTNDLDVTADAGKDTMVCLKSAVRIGSKPIDGVLYKWTPGTGLSDSTISNPFVTVTQPTIYTLKATSFGGGCFDVDEVLVTPIVVDTQLVLSGKDSVCISSGDSAVLKANTNFPVTWYRDSTIIAGTHGNTLKVLETGTYYAKIVSPTGCEFYSDAIFVFIEQPIRGIRYPTLGLIKGYVYKLTARSLGSQYLWTPATNLSDPALKEPSLIANTFPVDYTINITTAGGCHIIDTLSTIIFPKISIYVPGAFTPNGDGRNDYLKPFFRGFETINYFRIFDRYGNLVFDLKQNANGWDGKLKKVQQGNNSFVWVAQGVGVDKKTYVEKGTILLLR